MNPSSLPWRRLCSGGAALLVSTIALVAQDIAPPQAPDRIPVSRPAPVVDGGGPAVAPTAEQPSDAIEVHPSALLNTPVVGDQPDFAPWPSGRGVEGEVEPASIHEDPYVLAFRAADWRPAPGLDPRLEAAVRRAPDGASFAYAMIEGRMTAEDKVAALTARGCRILGVHTWQSYVVRVPHASVAAVASLPFVRWIGYPRINQKLDPELVAEIADASAGAGPDKIEVVVSVHTSDVGPATVVETLDLAPETAGAEQEAAGLRTRTIPNGPFQAALEAAGFTFTGYHEVADVFVFHGTAARGSLADLAALDFVAYVEPHRMPELADDQSMTMIGVDRVRASHGGSGVTVGVIDSGVQGGSGRHFDLNKFFVGWSNVSGEGAFLDGNGHGTHVTGTIGGTGSVDARYRGAAPDMGDSAASRVFIGRLFDNGGVYRGDFATLYAAMSNDFTSGGVTSPKPPVINNSWGTRTGSSAYIGSEASARVVDGYVWDHGQLHVFAAGNSGVGVSVEASAKNAMTVGSVSDFAGTGGPAGTMSSFSQVGTRDGRRKPEVVAPGNLITSTSHLSQSGYRNLLGTSMAAPHVTGALTGLVGHYSFLGYRPERLKAIACATAEWQGNPGASTGWFGANGGYGQLNAYRMHFTTPNHTLIWGGASTFGRSGDSIFWEVQIPADVTAIKAVVSWIEPAAAAGATAAKVNDLRGYLDIEPFSSAPNVGEFTMFVSADNSLSIASNASSSTGFAASAAGRRVRIKVHGQSVPTQARPGFALVAFRDDPYSTAPTLSVAADRTVVRTNAEVEVTATVWEGANGDEFANLELVPDFGPFSVLRMERTTADGYLHAYTGSSHPSFPDPSLTGGMVVGSSIRRSLAWRTRAPTTSGVYPLTVDATAFPRTSPTSATVNVCVDGLAPRAISGLTASSPTNTWTNAVSIEFRWSAASDNGCAGLAGLGTAFGRGSQADPTVVSLSATATSLRRTVVDTAGTAEGYRFKLRAIDGVDNRGVVAELGPFLIDTTDPIGQSITIAGGAATTTGLTVPVAVRATDAPSGVVDMRLSADGSTWSAWRSYATSLSVDLSANGGTAAEGVKRLFAQFRDRAGNVSRSIQDTIEYLRLPSITAAPVRSVATVGNAPLVLTGSDFQGVTRVRFGRNIITGIDASTFGDGWFEIVSDTQIRIFVPQGGAAGGYPVQLENAAGVSNAFGVTLVEPTRRVLATSPTLRAGLPQVWFTHHGGAVGGTSSFLVLSPFAAPSVIPGTIELGIGANFAVLFVVEPAAIHGVHGAAQVGPLPIPATLAGTTWHAQALQIDAANPTRVPFAVTNVASTAYR